MPADVFISYSLKDKEIARAVCKGLELEGIQCWIAPRDVLPGAEYADAIIEALNSSRVFLLILSQTSNTSPQVTREVERAVSKNLAILTFRIDNAILSKAMEYYLSNHHWMEATNDALNKQLHGLANAVKQLLKRIPQNKTDSSMPTIVPSAEPVEPIQKPKENPPPKDRELQPNLLKSQGQISNKRRTIWSWILLPIAVVALLSLFFLWGSWQSSRISSASPIPYKYVPPTLNPANKNATSTAQAEDLWVHGFAEPILSQIASRPPDFQEDFSDPNMSQWDEIDWDVFSVTEGVLKARITGGWSGIFPHFKARNFVAKYEFTPRFIDGASGGSGIDCHSFSFGLDISEQIENWWGLGYEDASGNYPTFISGVSTINQLMKTTRFTIIVRGTQFAVYIDDLPFAYTSNIPFYGEDINFFVGVEDSGTIELDLDNIGIWDLSK